MVGRGGWGGWGQCVEWGWGGRGGGDLDGVRTYLFIGIKNGST